ncbi:acyltransferase [Testudinibacter aquarius]|uniref:Acetyltransferase-like isoleucine patch superfamily enzyme n=1 Tax=Testudinibacter aquarius TaxID=1524974 RepID=A0A4R3Y367_9PAST|nr:acyltransferase [Testudinibacter aquarius]KAE9530130.1 hypothetical protein A1D24_07260 [Testudinibacter aquarius]TCV86635.1 acetyltransferase-like isoleucine patch superfamily enzyme [Testudinibacter aquarius]TNG91671.1 acyltransferase [Testudinibacter aquarius]
MNIPKHFSTKLIDNTFINLETFLIKDGKLFISGIGFIQGINVREYGDIDYKLVLKNESGQYIKQLAKLNKPEITEKYAENNIKYDKCFFTTFQENGLALTDVSLGTYELYLVISAGGVSKQQKIRTEKSALLQHPFVVDTDLNDGCKVLDKLIISTNFTKNIIPHNRSKQVVAEPFLDTAGNNLVPAKQSTNCFVRFQGKNNSIQMDPDANIKNLFIEILGDNNQVRIGKNVSLHGAVRLGHNCEVSIGDHTSSTNPVYVTCAEGTKLIIGNDCMFSTNNQIRTDDSHPIYDVNSGRRINPSRDIVIGDHVWIGYGVTISAGTQIGSGSVVGAYSFVRNQFPNNCVIAGVPARVVKKDVFWERPLLLNSQEVTDFTLEELSEKAYCQQTEDY